jgi:hypothetical protein
VIVVLVAAVVAACQLVLALDLTDETRPPDGGGARDPCVHALPPDPPDTDSPGVPSHDGGALVFAVRRFFFTDEDAGAGVPTGFDLDGVCTCIGGPGARFDGGPSCRPPRADRSYCDDDGGRDIGGNASFEGYWKLAAGGAANDPNAGLAAGNGTMLIDLRGYDGLPNQAHVSLFVFSAHGIFPTTEDGTAFIDGGRMIPRWDGSDRWTVDSRDFVKTTDLPVALGTAFVRDGFVVMKQSEIRASIAFGTLPIPVTIYGAVLVARVELTASPPRMRGRFTGRVSTSDILRAVGTTELKGTPACTVESSYGPLKNQVCEVADIMVQAEKDNTGEACDGVSLSLGFVAEPAVRGLQLDVTEAPSTCPHDDCPRAP